MSAFSMRGGARAWRGSLSRREGRAALRARWMALIALAGGAGEGWTPAKLLDFRHEALCLAPKTFPAEGASALGAAEGFLAFCLAYSDAVIPARRETLAPALIAAAKALDGLMHEDARAIARRSGWLDSD